MKRNNDAKWQIKTIVLLLLLNFTPFVYASDGQSKFILLQGIDLAIYTDNKYIELKRSAVIYGYGFISEEKVFVAFQNPKSVQGSAFVEVINLKTGKRTFLTEIGSAGEAYFESNKLTGEILFNSDGINIMKITSDNRWNIKRIKKTANLFRPFWIDNNTMGAIEYDDDFKPTVKTIKIKSRNQLELHKSYLNKMTLK